jgi:predicted DNA binding CopG/RHH family protein
MSDTGTTKRQKSNKRKNIITCYIVRFIANLKRKMEIEQRRSRGRPKLGNQQISFQLPPEMIQRLKEMAAKQGIKKSTLLQRILCQAL